ncbi:hypothetical protein ABZ942_43575 [Nocardia sp. NPDC046473]|uniref:hypothetical protein n=1 Tax=Nocardia sp. NPDC046473 TaxID=3155733 RepID=UPI0034076FB4
MTLQETIANDGFVHIEAFLDAREIDDLLEFAESTGHGSGEGSLGRRLVSVINDPLQISTSVQDKVKKLQSELFGYDMTLTQGVFFSVDPDSPEQSANFPLHQEHGSYYDIGDHLRYANLYIVLQKDDIANSNVTVIPFSELATVEPDLHALVVGAGAARYTTDMRFDDNTGSYTPFRTDLASIARTPQLAAGDLLVLRGDTIHGTQNQKSRRTAMSLRTVATDIVCHRESFDACCGTKLAFMLGQGDYFGVRDYVFENLGVDTITAGRLEHARKPLLSPATPADRPAQVDAHVAAFTAKLRDMQIGLQSAARG